MIARRLSPRRRGPASLIGPAAGLATLLALSGLLLLAGGCGKTPPEKNVIATVGDKQITQAYYETRLRRLKPEDLPRDPATGQPVDTATLAAKQSFLDVIVNKDLMYLKAKELGLASDDQIATATTAIMNFNAPTLMHYDLIEKPADTVTDAEVDAYYKNMQTQRRVSYVICNFEDDAKKARQAVIDGRLWADVADEFNDGSRGPNNDYTVTMSWGLLEDNFENAIWALKVGEISQPLPTVYGWWIVRLDAIDPAQVQPLDKIKDRVLSGIRAHKIKVTQNAFMAASRAKHDFKMDEGALWTIYQGLPEKEDMLDPVTKQPVPREQLQKLQIPLSDMDKFFYQVRLDDKLQTVTVGDYKAQFDNMNVFERPKKNDLLGGVRERICSLVDRQLLLQEAKERGYMNDPRATSDLDDKREQMMVTKLHDQVLKYDEAVTPEQANAFWAEHKSEYEAPESRFGQVVYCSSQDNANQALASARGGTEWEKVFAKFSDPNAARINERKLGPVPASANPSPLKDALFTLAQKGDVSQPFQIQNLWAIVRLDSVAAPRPRELNEVINEVGDRIKAQRAEEALQKLLAEWRTQFPVKVYPRRLMKCRSYPELAALPPENDPLRKPQVR